MKQKVRPSFFKSNTCWNLTIVLVSVLVLAFYVWTAGSNGVPLIVDVGPEYHEQVRNPNLFPDVIRHHYGFYNLLADSFAAGRVDLLLDPPQELLDLPNPRDPQANEKYRILDVSLFNNRFYLYFGPVPALVLFNPFRWLGIGKISEPLAVAFFSFGIYLSSLYILLTCVRRYIPNANKALVLFGILAIAFSNSVPYILRHPVVYEVAISSGAFFAMLGLALLLRSYSESGFSKGWIIAASAAFGLSVGCRAIYIFSSIFIFCVWLLIHYKRVFTMKSFVDGLCLALPFTILFAGVMAYNSARFGSPSDFGMLHYLGPTLHSADNMNSFSNLPPSLYFGILCPPRIDDIFPFIHFNPVYPLKFPQGFFNEEPNAGFLVTSPVTAYSLLFVGLWKREWIKARIGILVSLLASFGLLLMFIEKYMMTWSTQRYQLDFAPTILLGAVIGCIHLESTIKKSFKKMIISWGLCALLAMGVVIHVAFSFRGIFDTLRRGEPQTYFALQKAFHPVSRFLSTFCSSEKLQIVDLTAADGSAQFSDGRNGHWIGNKGLHLRIYSPIATSIRLTAISAVNPNLQNGVELEFKAPNQKIDILSRKGTNQESFLIRLHPGTSVLSFTAKPGRPSGNAKDLSQILILRDINLTMQ